MSRQPEHSLLATPPAGILKAIVWKELHDNLKWGIGGLLVMAAGLTYQIQHLLSNVQSGGYERIDALFTATTFGSALIGLLLGLAQSVPENRGDKWGFLAHRPTSRAILFRGKAIAGLILYTIAVSLPTAAAVVWLLLPGHIAMPLDWHIALPCAADLLSGVVFYFGALHTGMRDAKWFGTRAFSLGAGVVCSVLVTSMSRFSLAIAIAVTGIIVVGAAARATFLSGGRFESQPRTGRAAVVLSVGCGFIVAAAVVIAIVTSFVKSPANRTYKDYLLTSEGDIAQVEQTDTEILEVHDLNGRPIEAYQNYRALGRMLAASVKNSGPLWLGKFFYRPARYRSTDAVFVPLFHYGGSRSWYYVYGSGLFAEYSNRSGELAGWFGPDGFSPGPAKPRGFGDTYRHDDRTETVYTFANGVYRIDFEQRQVQKVFEPDTGESTFAAGSTTPAPAPENFVAIATTRRVVIQSEAGEVLFDRPHAAPIDKYPILNAYRALRAADKPFFLWYGNGNSVHPGIGLESRVVKLDAAGRTIHEQALPVIPQTEESHGAEIMTVLPVVPLAGRTAVEIAAHFRNYPEPWKATAALNAATWLVPAAFSLVFAVLTYRRGKKYAFGSRRLLLWTVLTVLLGPLAFFLMIAVAEWPAIERCPSCGRRRIVTNELCEHCHEPFVPPEMDGTEIFDFGEA